MQFIKKIILDKDGFTLVEIIIVIVMVSIFTLLAIPRISSFLGNQNDNFNLLTGIIAKTFDDSFLNERVNYLTFHLYEHDLEMESENEDEILSRDNGISVLRLVDGKFVDSTRKILKYRSFPESFKLVQVEIASGEKITIGNVMVPFYPKGYSDNIILHILVNDEDKWSIRIYKHMKEPEVSEDHISFESDE